MRFERVQRELYARPWALMPQVYNSFHEIFQARVAGDKLSASAELFGIQMDYPLPQEYSVVDGVAIVNIDGALGHRMDTIAKACMGMVDYGDIQAAIDKANLDDEVNSILLNINSPGGMVTGLKETADMLTASAKPVVAFTDSLAASAGYYLATSASAFYATHSSDVGCIGTLMSWIDVSEAMEREGYKAELIASGKYKGMGTQGIPLTEEQRAYLQAEVDELAQEFKDFVRARRGEVSSGSMEGQTMRAIRAIEANLIDEIGSFEDALTEAIELGGY